VTFEPRPADVASAGPTPATDPTGRPVGRVPVGMVAKATTVPVGHLLDDSVVPTPVGTRRLQSVRQPAFWLLIVLLLAGTARLAALVSTVFMRFPVAAAVAAVMFVLYAVPFVLVTRSVDFFEPEPPLLVGVAAGWGAVVALTTAISGNNAGRSILAKAVSPAFAVAWGPAIVGPSVEEVLKTLGVVVVVLIARKQVNSVADGAVYGAFVGLGFQIVEDFIYAANAVATAGQGDSVEPVIVTFLLRGFVAGLWSHTLFSALAGAGVAYFVVHRRNQTLGRRVGVALAGLAGAWLFHFVWNSPWLDSGFGAGGLGILAALIVKGAPALILIFLLIRWASGHEANFYLGTLLTLGDPRIITTREVAALRTGRRRWLARKYAYARGGRPGKIAARNLQRAQARLALDLSRGGRRAYPLRLAVLVSRRHLEAIGHPEAVMPPGQRRDWGAFAVVAALTLLVALAITGIIELLGAG
jgi:RsiW-degrading membrane proteinase PrsW (M82 family)